MTRLMKRGKERGVRYMVFPELALTTFFPRWYMEDRKEVERYFERQMPSADVLPPFEASAAYGIGFYRGYDELTADGRHFNTSILVKDTGRNVEIGNASWRERVCKALTNTVGHELQK